METVKEAISKHGNTWDPQVLIEMIRLYDDLYANSATDASLVQCQKATKYGRDDRHRLDTYYPKENSDHLLPVVVFFHGGAFVSGDNDVTRHIHSNIGRYFASHNCVACLATYRLVPHAKFPDGPDDIVAALKWVEANITSYGGDPKRVVAVGHSTGGAHLASALFMHKIASPIQRAVFLSTPMSFDLSLKRRRVVVTKYFNTEDDDLILSQFSSHALFKAMEDEPVCDISIFMAQFDPDEHLDSNLSFVREYRKRYKKAPPFEIFEGHNHASYVFVVGLGNEDQLGPALLSLVEKVSQ